MRVFGCQARTRNESDAGWEPSGRTIGRSGFLYDGFESEHSCWDPKDGELCPNRVKPEETLVEARSDTDVQIVRRTWV